MKRFTIFLNALFNEMLAQGRTGTWDTYLSASRSVLAFASNPHLTLKEVFNKPFLSRYQKYLLNRGCCYNTISQYMRVLRAIAHKAERRNLIVLDADLFEQVYTGSEPTRKRAIMSKTILRINQADLSGHPHLEMSRDLFMLSFHLQGISFVDLAYLRKADLRGDIITYHRRKTGSRISVQILEPAQKLLGRFLNTDRKSPYLLSILTKVGDSAHTQYRSTLRRYNRHLKALAELLGIAENLTSYVARHSWATAAYHIGVPTTIIGAAMGHRTEEVTRTYLASFDTETLTYANRMVMEDLFGEKIRIKKGKIWKNPAVPKGKNDVSFFVGKRR